MSEHRATTSSENVIDGIVIAASTLLMLVFVAHHPVASAARGTEVLIDIDRLRTADHVVHGALIALLLGLLAGFAGFANAAGRGRAAMRLGIVLYATGILAAIASALIDGFVIADLARHYAAAPFVEQATGLDLLVFAGFCVQEGSKLALVLMSSGIVTWGAVLLFRPGLRVIGLVGLLAGGATLAVLLGTPLLLRPATLLAILAGQAAWNACVAGQLIVQGRR